MRNKIKQFLKSYSDLYYSEKLSDRVVARLNIVLLAILIVFYGMCPSLIRTISNTVKSIVVDTPVEIKYDNWRGSKKVVESGLIQDCVDDYTEEQLTDLSIYVVYDISKYSYGLSPHTVGFQRQTEIYLKHNALVLSELDARMVIHHEIAHYLYRNLDDEAKQEIKEVFDEANKITTCRTYISEYAKTNLYEDIAETWGIGHACDTSENNTNLHVKWNTALKMKYHVLQKYFELDQ